MALPELNQTGILAVSQYLNDITNGIGWTIILGAIFVTFFIFFILYGPRRAFISSGLITTVLSLALWRADLVPTYWIFIYILVASIGLAIPNDAG